LALGSRKRSFVKGGRHGTPGSDGVGGSGGGGVPKFCCAAEITGTTGSGSGRSREES